MVEAVWSDTVKVDCLRQPAHLASDTLAQLIIDFYNCRKAATVVVATRVLELCIDDAQFPI
eukprot:scaffold4902_cov147-Skeletonema_marinoi.AAC.1